MAQIWPTPAGPGVGDDRGTAGPAGRGPDEMLAEAGALLPGGTVGGYWLPEDLRFIVDHGRGSRLWDVGGREYIDYVCGAGALILGHAPAAVVAAVQEQAARGMHFFGTPNEACVRLARVLVDAIPCAGKIAFASTGSEATFYAMRLARAHTGRNKVLKCEGGYHGNHDYSNFSVAPAALSNYPAGQADTAGIPESLAGSVLVAPYNDLEAVRRIVADHRDDLAAVIVEPVQRIVFPADGYLDGLRAICDENGVLLIFDEVVTGFRLAWGGAQEYFGVRPDLASYGKIIGGGGPVACVAGPAEILDRADPQRRGSAGFALLNGTLHGNPVGSAAGLATLCDLRSPGFYAALEARGRDLRAALQTVLDRHRVPAIAAGASSLWQIVFCDRAPASHADIMAADPAATRALDIALLREGVYVLPAMRRFVSAAHDDADLEATVRALDNACRAVARGA